MRIVTKGSEDKYIFTDVCEERPESIAMLKKLAREDVGADAVKLDITSLEDSRAM